MAVKPLARHVDCRLASARGLDAEQQRLKDGASMISDEDNCDLAGDAADDEMRHP